MPRNQELWVKSKHEWYERNKGLTKSRSYDRWKRKRQEFEEFKKQFSCCICKEDEFLLIDFHHIDPNTKENKINTIFQTTLRMDRVKEEVKKCIPLCGNCHRLYHYGSSQRAIDLQIKVNSIIDQKRRDEV